MEESLREYELRNVYSYCELDDPKYQNFLQRDFTNSNLNFRREFNELDLNQRAKEAELGYNYYVDDKRKMRGTSQDKYI